MTRDTLFDLTIPNSSFRPFASPLRGPHGHRIGPWVVVCETWEQWNAALRAAQAESQTLERGDRG